MAKIFKSSAALLLALITVVSVFTMTSCTDNGEKTPGDDAGTTTNAAATTTAAPETEATHDENGYLLDDLPKDLNFNNVDFSVLYWSDVEKPEFEAAELNGDIVNDAIFERNRNVEERLGVKLKWTSTPGNNGNTGAFNNFVLKSYNSGEHAYDLIGAYSRTTGMLATNKLLVNLGELDYLNLDMPWWPASLTSTVKVNNKIFFISGDASTNLLHIMYGLYYNKNLLTDYSLPDPADLVKNNEWTLDKLIEISSGYYKDLNNDNKADITDFYGYVTVDYHNDALFQGADLKMVEPDQTSLLIISPSFYSEKAANFIDKVSGWQNNSNNVYRAADYQNAFINGNAIFCENRVYMAEKYLRNVPFIYAIVPTPKYDAFQEDYITCVGNPVTLYGIPADSLNLDSAGAVLECWASEAYRLTTPALFETNMKLKYAESDVTSQMFDIIKRTIAFDLGRIYGASLQNINNMPANAIIANQSWTTVSNAYKKLFDKLLGSVIAIYS